MNNLDTMLGEVFGTLTDKKSSLFIFVTLFTALYGGKAAPPLPQVFVDLFTQPWFRIAVLSLIAWAASIKKFIPKNAAECRLLIIRFVINAL